MLKINLKELWPKLQDNFFHGGIGNDEEGINKFTNWRVYFGIVQLG